MKKLRVLPIVIAVTLAVFTWTTAAYAIGERPHFQIIGLGTGYALDVQAGSNANGVRVVSWTSTAGTNQRWERLNNWNDGNGIFTISSDLHTAGSGIPFVLDANLDSRSSTYRSVVIWEGKNTDNQKWWADTSYGGGYAYIHNKQSGGDCLTDNGFNNQLSVRPCQKNNTHQLFRSN